LGEEPEFYFGGQIVKKELDEAARTQLEAKGVQLFRMANQALDAVARQVCGRGFLEQTTEGKGGA
jgi:hypothetical protein